MCAQASVRAGECLVFTLERKKERVGTAFLSHCDYVLFVMMTVMIMKSN